MSGERRANLEKKSECPALLNRVQDENTETIPHLFFDCPTVEQLLSEFFSWILRENNRFLNRNEFFVGFNYESQNKNSVLDYCTVIVKKYIWDCKQRFCIPSFHQLKINFLSNYGNMYKISKKIREYTDKSDLFVNHQEIHF